MEREIVITGMGAVTPVGIGVAEFWNGLLAGRCGIGPVTSFDTSALQVHAAAQVADFDAAARCGHKAIHALSLPAACAPETAGEIVARTVREMLREREGAR